jgi:prolyl-tRNA editing enzyme YbaK/EbsC (Cys-tRNA(Pro) deacylase)
MQEKTLEFKPILQNSTLVPSTVYDAIKNFNGKEDKDAFKVASINPDFLEGLALCSHYGLDKSMGANCLVVEAVRNEVTKYAACLVPVGYKYDMNKTIRKLLNARRVSVAPLDFVLEKTKMEMGSIGPIGLPDDWYILVDEQVMKNKEIIVGGGFKTSKLLIPSSALLSLPNFIQSQNIAK